MQGNHPCAAGHSAYTYMNTHSHRLYHTLLWVMLAIAGVACDTTVKTDEAEIGAAINYLAPFNADQTFQIDTAGSSVTWIGAKVTGRHNGLIPVKQGTIMLHNGKLQGGKALLDMTGVRSEDKSIDEAGNLKLTKHLRSADFFDVEQHPVASFEITSVAPYDSTERQEVPAFAGNAREMRVKDPNHKVTGNLTIKGITKSISFPARIEVEDSVLRAKANFNIDRTHWRLSYGSDQSLGNRTIYPAVNIGLDIVANLQ
ncbi:YceI family protein [Pontibacter ramchanderi]|uniref:Polyisoprenoid-binding protein YceI n=1 Tax=Pontibacter ramchanderi TaxID=1179743 RepID=A0A2N3UC34_9BACT|nr:YceI family protein [Pontibacter ramchanderi]PKV66950.1 polyisoprenoid-binding protein YceI [Pontibacter ramchanderi]